jgi:hypothetical protein
MNTHGQEIFTGTTGLHFYWAEREDGAELFYARNSDGSSVEVLSAEELGSAEELIHSLTLLTVQEDAHS